MLRPKPLTLACLGHHHVPEHSSGTPHAGGFCPKRAIRPSRPQRGPNSPRRCCPPACGGQVVAARPQAQKLWHRETAAAAPRRQKHAAASAVRGAISLMAAGPRHSFSRGVGGQAWAFQGRLPFLSFHRGRPPFQSAGRPLPCSRIADAVRPKPLCPGLASLQTFRGSAGIS